MPNWLMNVLSAIFIVLIALGVIGAFTDDSRVECERAGGIAVTDRVGKHFCLARDAVITIPVR